MSERSGTLEALIAESARTIDSAFADYLAEFRAITAAARSRFEARNWRGHQQDALSRLDLYSRSMRRITEELRGLLGELISNHTIWARIKDAYAGGTGEVNSELARTFFNSVTRRVFATVGVNPEIEFVSLDPAVGDRQPDPRILRGYVPRDGNRELVLRILQDYRFAAPYQDPERDARLVAGRIEDRLRRSFGGSRIDRVELLRSVFYRNKAAYVVGRVLSGADSLPLVLALLHPEDGVVVDAVLTRESDVSILFSFTRSYFHVDTGSPLELIVFLKAIMPPKPVAELYSALGFNKHAKTEFYRSLERHLRRSSDLFEFASGDRGMVMLVYTLPSFDRVFKVIRDDFAFPKNTTARSVIERYRLVFKRDRVGRLVEAQSFLQLKFKLDRFEDDLRDDLLREASKTVHREGDHLVFERLYTERRVTPLNVYLRRVDADAARAVIEDYGAAIKELAAANIFPGDFLLKNFGVTRHGRVVFYDYDELCLLGECNFRRLPAPRTHEQEMAAEPWFAVADNDVFPEEFRKFLGLPGPLRELFEEQHGDLFTVDFWRGLQEQHRRGVLPDFYPYPEGERLRSAAAGVEREGRRPRNGDRG